MESLEDRWVLSGVTVGTLADLVDSTNMTSIAALIANPGIDGKISLREAITAANADAALDEISFDASNPAINGGQILLTRANGQLNISSSLTIDASALDNGITIKGEDNTGGFHNNGDGIRLFNITDPSSGSIPPLVTMIGLTLTGADPAPGADIPQGGAIRSEGILTLRNMVLTENGAGLGAGVYLAVAGTGAAPRTVLTIENSHIEHNSAYQDGGGVFVQFSSASGGQDTVSIDGSVLSHNLAGPLNAPGNGGALFISADFGSDAHHAVIVTSSVFETNEADSGGAVYQSTVSSRVDLSILADTSVSGNTATSGSGGGMYVSAGYGSQLRIERATISGNTSAFNGGGLSARLYSASSLFVEDSVVSGNTATYGSGGGVYARADNGSLFRIEKTTISGNTSAGNGG